MLLLVIGHPFVRGLGESLGDELRTTVSVTFRNVTNQRNWRDYGQSFGRDVTICLDNVVAGDWTLVCPSARGKPWR